MGSLRNLYIRPCLHRIFFRLLRLLHLCGCLLATHHTGIIETEVRLNFIHLRMVTLLSLRVEVHHLLCYRIACGLVEGLLSWGCSLIGRARLTAKTFLEVVHFLALILTPLDAWVSTSSFLWRTIGWKVSRHPRNQKSQTCFQFCGHISFEIELGPRLDRCAWEGQQAHY